MVLRTVIVFELFALTLAAVCSAQPQATGCLSYEPAVVQLTGTVIRETFPGPPNYESVRNGERPETYWILHLEHPICVDADKTDSGYNSAQIDIQRVQLVLAGGAAYKKYKKLLSKKVIATGTLFGSHTGHHHTTVLLTAQNLVRAK
jgi:hypothetical protein